ncbi:MAG: ATP-binding protein [Oscillospiraceae bacterium]|nr:ATP-binding protein [Oscillospiraceae bacterium]
MLRGRAIQPRTITFRLIITFVLIIAIFLTAVIYSGVASRQMNEMHRHNMNHVVARTVYITELHQEFTEMRRLLGETLMSPEWRQSASAAAWSSTEHRLGDHYRSLIGLAGQYEESIRGDNMFTGEEKAMRLDLITGTLEHVSMVYTIFRDNFFLVSSQSFDHGNVLDHSGAADEMFREMRALAIEAGETIWASIDAAQTRINFIMYGAFVLALTLAAMLGFLTVQSFKNKVRSVRENVAMVMAGDFKTSVQRPANDEMSEAFAFMTRVFIRLIDEIKNVTRDVKNDNSERRIDLTLFEGGYREAAIAINDLLDTVVKQQVENDRMKFMFDHMPLISTFFDSEGRMIDCNDEAVRKLRIPNKSEYMADFDRFSPEFQPNGRRSSEYAAELISDGLRSDYIVYDWVKKDADGNLFPTEITGVSGNFKGEKVFVTYIRDVTVEKEAQAREHDANERMRMMFDATPLLIELWDDSFNCVDANPFALALYNIESKAEYEQRVHDFVPPIQPNGVPSEEYWRAKLEETRDSGYTAFYFVCQKPDGTPVYTNVVGISMKMSGKTVLVTYSNDITELVLSQQTAKDAMERTQLMFDAAPMLIEFWNQNIEVIDYNPFALALFGIESSEDYARRYDEFIPKTQPNGTPSWSYWVSQLKKVFDEGYNAFEMTMTGASGELINAEVIGIRMTMNNEVMAVTYSNNVTQVKESIKKIKKAEERTKTMLDANPVACYLISADFEILDCNREALTLFHFSSKEESLEKSKNIFTQRGFAKFKQQFDTALTEGFKRFSWDLDLDNGEVVPFEISLVRVELEDACVVAAYLHDMTAIKQMLEQQERVRVAEESSQAKSRFLASMSHEIRTPITAVLGISEIQLQNLGLPPETEAAFARIFACADALLNITNDLLDISKIEAGKMHLIVERYEVAGLASDTIQMHLVYSGNKNIRFAINIDENIPAWLKGDPFRIKQILSNLLSNAFKYTDAGEVTLSMACQHNARSGAQTELVIQVADTGKGLTQEQIAALQDDYARFHERESRLIQGTGLGMPIVCRLVELMSGQINVESQVGVGTTVTVRLPQEVASEEKLGREMVESLRRHELRPILTRKEMDFVPEPMPYGSVLLVDDVETNLFVAKGLMGLYGLQIETVNSGFAAIEKVKSGKAYDIIFMDHIMPELDGVEATKIIRRLGYTAPILALTASTPNGRADAFLRDGFDGCISKPIQSARLNAMLKKFVQDKHTRKTPAAVGKDIEPPVLKMLTQSVEGYYASPEIASAVRKEFLRTQSDLIQRITGAIDSQDMITAHRIAHTLKGLAGMTLEDKRLVDVAGRAEDALKKGEISAALVDELRQEVEFAIERVAWQLKDAAPDEAGVS